MYLLLYLAQKAGLHSSLDTSTSIIAKDLNVSQQTISRKLRDFENKEWIKRNVSISGITISLADKGRDELKDHYTQLNALFNNKKDLKGKVFSGLGEGKFYVSVDGYKKEFEKVLGSAPYKGTLNIRVRKSSLQDFLAAKECIRIKGFKTKQRTYGGLDCYKIKINNTEGAVIIPDRTNHNPETAEIIAPLYLRGKYKLNDGDEVKLK